MKMVCSGVVVHPTVQLTTAPLTNSVLQRVSRKPAPPGVAEMGQVESIYGTGSIAAVAVMVMARQQVRRRQPSVMRSLVRLL